MTRRTARILVIALLVATLTPIALVAQAPSAKAVSASLWNPGLIISDQEFYDGSAMNANDIQAFLNAKVPNCQSGYTCLKNHHQATPSIAADAYCAGYVGAPDESAATIIAKVGQSCNISQKALLVIMQKEMSLVTLTAPTQWRFDKAMGFACPDSAVCDPAYSGFFYQVFYGARQFQRYSQHPTSYNYQAGRYNNILYHPNRDLCGFSSVYVSNKATAGLYNYTPYQPNPAALANLYSTGDSCSSYGNRNFFRYYWDWFGSPVTSNNLLRTLENPSVYIVSGNSKYLVATYAEFLELSPLGGVGYVSQQYLDAFTTGPVVGRVFRNTDGTIALFDRGLFFAFATCDQMEDFGYSCTGDQFVQLTNDQFAAFQTGPVLTSVVGTPTGGRYFIDNGSRSEILDTTSQTLAGIPEGMVILSDAAIGSLPHTAPIIRDGVLVRDRDRGSFGLIEDNTLTSLAPGTAESIGASTRTAGSLDSESIDLIPSSGLVFDGLVSDGAGNTLVLTPSGRLTVTGGGLTPADSPPLPESLLELWPDVGTLTTGQFIKPSTDVTIYIITEISIRPISSWSAFLSLSPTGPPEFRIVPPSLIARMTVGSAVLTSGQLVRSPEKPEVYLIDGLTSKVWVPSFPIASAAGYNGFSYVPQAYLDAYPLNSTTMTYGYQCGTTRYLAANGALHKITPEREALYPIPFVSIDPYTCARARYGTDAERFIRTPNGIIFLLEGGQKLPIPNWSRWLQIYAGSGWLDVQFGLADLIPTGPSA